jgi:hypothetical protein
MHQPVGAEPGWVALEMEMAEEVAESDAEPTTPPESCCEKENSSENKELGDLLPTPQD